MLGKLVIPVSAYNTSQDCSGCGEKVPKKLHERWHDCSHCGCSLDRDHNAAIVIRNRAVGHPVLNAQSMSEAIAGVTQKPTPMVTACVGVGVCHIEFIYYFGLTSPLSAFTQKVLRFSGLVATIAKLSSKINPTTRQTFPISAYDHCLYSTLAAEQRPINDVVHRIKG